MTVLRTLKGSGTTLRVYLGVAPEGEPLQLIELWIWEAYDRVEPMNSEAMMIAKVVAAEYNQPYCSTYMPSRFKYHHQTQFRSRGHQRGLAKMFDGLVNLFKGKHGRS